jgi:hypothetical protein
VKRPGLAHPQAAERWREVARKILSSMRFARPVVGHFVLQTHPAVPRAVDVGLAFHVEVVMGAGGHFQCAAHNLSTGEIRKIIYESSAGSAWRSAGSRRASRRRTMLFGAGERTSVIAFAIARLRSGSWYGFRRTVNSIPAAAALVL